mmetsp:Transcript_117159/g.239681  ORF Transcript_117159/g.239681 Transcript_117159/m.239681 type:complete len:436 (+) Transcript_117159:95-1402(+)
MASVASLVRRRRCAASALSGMVLIVAASSLHWGVGEVFVALRTLSSAPDGGRHHSTGSSGGSLTGPVRAGPSSSSPGASLLRFSAVLALATALAAKRGTGRVKPPPEELIPRAERPKGSQVVPLGKRLQKLFSVRNRQFWDYTVFPRVYFDRKWKSKDFAYAAVFSIVHVGALFAPFYFTWKAFMCFLVGYGITGMLGITLSYHRQLAHRSFKSPKIVEYFLAYCGALALQSHPINWVSSHRHHHGATDTENDVHSPKDGFWWAHMGWLLDQTGTWMRCDKNNASDLSSQWFYRFLQKTYPLHAIVLPVVGLYAFGGLPCLLWGFFFRVVWVWHVTWAVNSVSHVWGFQDWNTGDVAMNNWLIGILAFGEGWHNNHHAFENSCRHGLKWWQIDMTWYTVKLLEFFGLAWDLKYPTEGKMRRLSWDRVADGVPAMA